MARQILATSTDPKAEWTISVRQPWADKAVQPAKPTDEQLEWLKQEGFIKDEEDEEVRKAPPFWAAYLDVSVLVCVTSRLLEGCGVMAAPFYRREIRSRLLTKYSIRAKMHVIL